MSKGIPIVQILAFVLLTVLFAMGPTCPKNGSGYDVAECGNGVAEEGEDCDTTDYRAETCATLNHGDGEVGCLNCMWDFSQCSLPTSNSCNNGVAEPGEDCDAPDLRDQTCASLYHGDGLLNCSDCRWNLGSCHGTCGVPLIQPLDFNDTRGAASLSVGASDGKTYCKTNSGELNYPGQLVFRSDGTGRGMMEQLEDTQYCSSRKSGHRVVSVQGGEIESYQEEPLTIYDFTYPIGQDVTVKTVYVCYGVSITIVINVTDGVLTVKSVVYN